MGRARRLRRNQTDVERLLWNALRGRQLDGAKFRRQVPIGQYIVDFICPSHRLIVELDGGQHAERAGYDDEHTRFLIDRGYRVVRFWNNDVAENLAGVLATIAANLDP